MQYKRLNNNTINYISSTNDCWLCDVPIYRHRSDGHTRPAVEERKSLCFQFFSYYNNSTLFRI